MNPDDNDLEQAIGMPATLELCAEECMELAHICLKIARKIRDENPTPRTFEEMVENLKEELADVTLCVDSVEKIMGLPSDEIDDICEAKRSRWADRMKYKRNRI